jgi:hypothetical protein
MNEETRKKMNMKTKTNLLTVGILLAVLLNGFGQPVITTQPQDQTNYVGTTATLTVVATRTGSVFYQWQKFSTGFADLAGHTNAVLSLTNVQTNDAADYRVVVTDATGTTNSAAAHLSVAMPETLFISQPAPGLVTLSWRGNMVLLVSGLYSGSLDCPAWVRVAGTSPVTLSIRQCPQFFRLVALPSEAELQAADAANIDACRAQDVNACEACVAAYFLTAPMGSLPPSGEHEEAASIGISLGSCISAAQADALAALYHIWYGP